MPEVKHKQRGGLILGEWTWFEMTVPILLANVSATWPFVVIEFRDDSLSVKAWPFKVHLQLSDIYGVDLWTGPFWRLALGGASGVRIHHHGRGPKFVVFSTYRRSRLMEAFEQLGVRVL